MSFVIDIQNDHDYAVDVLRLQQAAIAVLKRHDVEADSEMSVVISTNDAVHQLNLQHRDVDAPTDVLSFPADPLPPELRELSDDALYLGDLIIAHDYALEQALREKHDFMDSLSLLVIHGTLHLLGYDHDTPDNRAEMWASQAEALTELGISDAIVPALENSDHA